jgi:hypothetical protein
VITELEKMRKEAFCLPPAFTLVSRSACFFDPEDRGDNSSETSVDTQRTTLRYIPEDGTLQEAFKVSDITPKLYSRPIIY